MQRLAMVWAEATNLEKVLGELSEYDQEKAVDGFTEVARTAPAGTIKLSIFTYLRNRGWEKPGLTKADFLASSTAAMAEPKPAAKATTNNPVQVLPGGDQIALGSAPQIWIKRSDPRWLVAAERFRRERGKQPQPHGSGYFAGYGYAFPLGYFATLAPDNTVTMKS
jgi:hypothetical protein